MSFLKKRTLKCKNPQEQKNAVLATASDTLNQRHENLKKCSKGENAFYRQGDSIERIDSNLSNYSELTAENFPCLVLSSSPSPSPSPNLPVTGAWSKRSDKVLSPKTDSDEKN
jgi:hypothetical protein